MARVLYLSIDGMTDPLGQSQVLVYLKGLSALGHEITLISFEKPERASLRPLIEKFCAENKIDWQPMPYTNKPPVISTFRNVKKMIAAGLELHQSKRFQIVHCRSYVTSLAGMALQRQLGIKYIFDMRGFFPDERKDGGVWNPWHPILGPVYWYFKHKEGVFLKGADHVISLTHKGKEIIHAMSGLAQCPITVIPCCADMGHFDPSRFTPEQKMALKDELGIQSNEKTICYVGSIGTWYLLNDMLAFCEYVLSQDASYKFLFWTNEGDLVKEKLAQLGLPEERFIIKPVLRDLMPLHISIADFGLFFIMSTYSKQASSPVKQGEMMAMGLPIVCNNGVGDTTRFVEEANGGIVLKGFEKSDFEEAFCQMKDRTFDKNEIRKTALKYYDSKEGINMYAGVYEALVTLES